MIVDCAVYVDGRRRAGQLEVRDARDACSADEGFVWIGLVEPTEEEFDSVRREFDLHELAVEDAIKAHQRPKIERYGDSWFMVLKTARYVDSEEVVEFGEILIFIGESFIITVRHGVASDLHPVRLRVEERPDLLRCGPSAVLHAIIDKVVDDYQPVVEGVDKDIEEVEEQVFSHHRGDPTERIYNLKREVIEFHRAVAPLIDPLGRLARRELGIVHEDMASFYRDVYDHALRANERVEGFREVLTSVLEANLAQVSIRQNEDVRKISAWVAIIAVPTMIAGIYGMNFEHMPELEWTYGYPAALGAMLLFCAGLYRYFKKVGWL